ncbi:MAG TPA: DUF6504 family protein [Ornithinibacter sp.]|nr:DUF6504 family protein [Ornithinibacter sp.]
MRRYDDPVDVRPVVDGSASFAPGQFLWRGRLYIVGTVLAHWIEVGAWWRVRDSDGLPVATHAASRQMWRVEARTGPRRVAPHTETDERITPDGRGLDRCVGVYDLAYDETAEPAAWRLAHALD